MNKIQIVTYQIKVRKEFQKLSDELFRATEEEVKREHQRRYEKKQKKNLY